MTSDSIIRTNDLIPYLETILTDLKNSTSSSLSFYDKENVVFALYQIQIWKLTPENQK